MRLIYRVKKGDTLEKISAGTGLPAEKIAADNQLENGEEPAQGQALLLLIPGEKEETAAGGKAGGYACTDIAPDVLKQALPALQELLVFPWGFTFEGNLVPPPRDDMWMIEAARQESAEPFLVLTPFPGGAFHGQLVKVLMESELLQEKVISRVLRTVLSRGYAGAEVDFAYVLPEDRIRYAQFVGRLRSKMNENGCSVSVSVAPKTSDSEKGLKTEGIDYGLLGANADAVFLLTFGWGYAYGPPGAVAPLDKVRRVVEYALTRIPAEKLILGIPNYGYDWPLPYESGMTRARMIGNEEAAGLAAETGAVIEYACTPQAPWFQYKKSGIRHTVWFEDPGSIQAKWNLVNEYSLRGARYRNLMQPFRVNWLMTGGRGKEKKKKIR